MQDGFDCEATAAFLSSGRTVSNAANAVAVIAGVGCWWSIRGPVSILLGLSLAAFVVQTWFAVRVAIDRSLFQALANGEDRAKRMDVLLVDWKLVKTVMADRSMGDRSRGALALWRKQSTALAIQLLALGGAIILHTVTF
jgi:hypothetical protein